MVVDDMSKFINLVDLIQRLAHSISNLYQAGHYAYQEGFVREWSRLEGLKEWEIELKDGLTCWKRGVAEARRTHSSLNYFDSRMLTHFLNLMTSENDAETENFCLELLQWVKDSATIDHVREMTKSGILSVHWKAISSEVISLNEWLLTLGAIGEALEPVISPSSLEQSDDCCFSDMDKKRSQDAIILLMAEDQKHEMLAVISVFHGQGWNLQDAGLDVLVCQESTLWEEVHLLLLRCFEDRRNVRFYCILFVERLAFDVQRLLVDTLVDMVSTNPCTCSTIAVVGLDGCQILHSLSQELGIVVNLETGSNMDIQRDLQSSSSEMTVVVSDLPGMGKTTWIHDHAAALNLDIVTIPISGVISRQRVLRLLKNLNPTSTSLLHLDIGPVSNIDYLSVLLFEILILRRAKVSDGILYRLGHTHIAVEIANSLGNSILDGLPVCSWLKCIHLAWDLTRLKVSNEVDSDIQVVCHYLAAINANNLDVRDLCFTSSGRNVQLLPETFCMELLQQHFITPAVNRAQSDEHHGAGHAQGMSFSLLHVFISLLSYQLRILSGNYFFLVNTLKEISTRPDIRSLLVRGFIEVIRELTLRSTKPWTHEQQENLQGGMSVDEDLMEARMQGMIRWADSNHLLVMFHHDATSIFALYRQPSCVPNSVQDLLISQFLPSERKALKDFSKMPSEELWQEIHQMFHSSFPGQMPNYAFTADNILKMALIALRVRASVPVLVMGETGCGKTSLVKTLATISGVEFYSMCMHAGTTHESISSFVQTANTAAKELNKKVWVFLDEINTCDHLGLIKEILCRHSLEGTHLDKDLVVLAACNPYRLSDSPNAIAGLQMEKFGLTKSRLAYRVHPLPEAMLDFVWDYGLLSRTDERAYIATMVGSNTEHKSLLINLLADSQEFTRQIYGEASVSLRDVQRCLSLQDWFEKDLCRRPLFRQKRREREVSERAMVLAFSHCYYARLTTQKHREEYEKLYKRRTEGILGRWSCKKQFKAILRDEQMDLLKRMEMIPGTGVNSCLLETVFVMLVCILNRLPIFVIGKPGSGKTLALQLIYSNLRGRESKDIYFQKLPKMYMLPYQGSESSTSEGIVKVFDRAKRYVSQNTGDDLVVVVVLDEVGLAEVSANNPLKVLHTLLEPDVHEVAVVGISNWALDAAKMNRAIHLSQPDPTPEDLLETSKAIIGSFDLCFHTMPEAFKETIKHLCQAYSEYSVKQSRKHFHGLRDFYALIRSLKDSYFENNAGQKRLLYTALTRNFGGSPDDHSKLELFFKNGVESFSADEILLETPPVLDLIRANINDRHARHLLLITRGSSGAGIMEYFFGKQHGLVTIFGSQYRDDCSDDYSYTLLSAIILHMEAGRLVLLQNLKQIWTSLYDMLNQHYTVVGGRSNCRIALGPYSNPMCFVHENFRCVVTVDETNLSDLDPPFVNRFEKQVLTYESLLTKEEKTFVEQLTDWVKDVTSIVKNQSDFTEQVSVCFTTADTFNGFNQDTLPSLVALVSRQGVAPEFFLLGCQQLLLKTASADGIIRIMSSRLSQADSNHIVSEYLASEEALNLPTFLRTQMDRAPSIGIKAIIFTKSSLRCHFPSLLSDCGSIQVEHLGSFTSEKQLQTCVQNFFFGPNSSNLDFLVLRVHAATDLAHLSHAKFVMDETFRSYEELEIEDRKAKHMLLIIHQSGKSQKDMATGFDFLCGWELLALDNLEPSVSPVGKFLNKSISEVINSGAYPFAERLPLLLTWALMCLKFPFQINSASYIQKTVHDVCHDSYLVEGLQQKISRSLNGTLPLDWQILVACSQHRLTLAGSLHNAFIAFIDEKVRSFLAKLMFVVEGNSPFIDYFEMGSTKQEVWRDVVFSSHLLNTSTISEPRYPSGYKLNQYAKTRLPFSSHFAREVDQSFKDLYLEEVSNLQSNLHNRDNIGNLEIKTSQVILLRRKYQENIDALETSPLGKIAGCVKDDLAEYAHDLAAAIAVRNGFHVEKVEDLHAWEWVLLENVFDSEGILNVVNLHATIWEREQDIVTQVQLALNSLPQHTITTQLEGCLARVTREDEILVTGNVQMSYLHRFTLLCCEALWPIPERLSEVGLKGWVEEVNILLSLTQFSGKHPIVLALETLQSIATLLLENDRSGNESFTEVAGWAAKKGGKISISDLYEKLLNMTHREETGLESIVGFDVSKAVLCTFLENSLACSDDLEHFQEVALCAFSIKSPSCQLIPVLDVLLRTNRRRGNAPLTGKIEQLDSKEEMKLFFKQLFREGQNNNAADLGPLQVPNDTVVMFCDMLHTNFCPPVSPELLRGKNSEMWEFSEFCDFLKEAISQAQEVNEVLSLRTLCSMALLKSTIKAVSCAISQVGGNEPNSIHPEVLTLLNSFGGGGFVTAKYLKLLLLKELRFQHNLSLIKVRQLYNQEIIDFETICPEVASNTVEFNPFESDSEDYKAADKALGLLIQRRDDTLMRSCFQVLEENIRAYPFALMCVIASRLWLIKSQRPLDEGEKHACDWLKSEALNFPFRPSYCGKMISSIANNSFPHGSLLELRQDVPTNEFYMKAISLHLFITLACLPSGSPFLSYMTLEPQIVASFFIAAPSDETTAAINAVQGGTRWRCNGCGCYFVVANCGWATEQANCPDCKGEIGDGRGSHGPVAGATKVDTAPQTHFSANDQPGYLPDQLSREFNHTVRSLPPLVYRLLHLISRAALLFGFSVCEEEHIPVRLSGLPSTPREASLTLTNIVYEDFDALNHLLGQGNEITCLLLDYLLPFLADLPSPGLFQTSDQRMQWEVGFSEMCERRILKNPRVVALTHKDSLLQNSKITELERLLVETDVDPNRPFVANILRYTIEPSVEKLQIDIFSGRPGMECPFLKVFFKHKENLGKIQQIIPLVEWAKVLHSRLSHSLTRLKAVQMTVFEFLRKSADRSQLEEIFEKFAGAWNALRPKVRRFRCREFSENEIPEMSLARPLALCLMETRDSGAYLCGMLEMLANFQNSFLEEVEALKQQDSLCPLLATREEGMEPTRGQIRSIPAQMSTMKVVVYDEDWAEGVVRKRSMAGLEYGCGFGLSFDFECIKNQLARLLVVGKCHLDVGDLQEFPYEGESFSQHAEVLSIVGSKVAQGTLKEESIRAISVQVEDAGIGVGSVLASLHICLGYLEKTGGDPSEPLLDYAERWLDKSVSSMLDSSSLRNVQLRHIVCLYEGLEDVLSQSIDEFVHGNFRKPLTEEVEIELKKVVTFEDLKKGKGKAISETNQTIQADVFASVLRRFMFRYLAVENFKGKDPLKLYMVDNRIANWPLESLDVDDLEDLLPDSLLLEHSFECYQFLRRKST